MAVELTRQSLELGIVTENPDAMVAFYRDTLGFEFERSWDMPSGGTMYRLKLGDNIIKILKMQNTPPATAPGGGVAGATGYRYWTIFVADMEKALSDVEKDGHTVVMPPTDIGPGVRMSFVADPDGNWLELVGK